MLPSVPRNPNSTVVADFDNANKISAALMTERNSKDSTRTECAYNMRSHNNNGCECDWNSQVCFLSDTILESKKDA